MPDVLSPEVAAVLGIARREGRSALLEPEALQLARALGLGVPHHVVVPDAAAVLGVDLARFPGDRVVVKVVSDEILHKSDVGGVDVVSKDLASVSASVAAMAARLRGRRVVGFGLFEYVPHDQGLGGQVLLGARWTEDFGAVVTLGAGGIHAEFLAREMRPRHGLAILSPALGSPAEVAAALAPAAIVRLLTEPQRGQPPRIDLRELAALLEPWLAFAQAAMPRDLVEIEVNPLVLTPRGPVALDALVKLGTGAPVRRAPRRPLEKLSRLLRPASLAVMGVSDKGNVGRLILQNVLREGFPAARTFVVKPGRESLDGCACVPDVASLPEPVDVLVVCVDAAQVPQVVEDAVRTRNAEALLLIPGGMGERPGTEGHVDRVRHAVETSRKTPWRGPLLNGGNCLGIRSIPGRYDTLFIPKAKLAFPAVPAAPLAFVSQSGAFAVARSSRLWSLNPRYLVTIGNQVDLTVGDYAEWLLGDAEVRVVAVYVEGFRPGDGLRFAEAARELVRAGRTVVLYRAGRTAAGAKATASHTASMAGDYAVTRALAEQAGVLVADSPEEFDELASLAVRLEGRTFGGRALGAMSNAGFECVAIADNLGDLHLARFAPETVRRVEEILASARLQAIVGAQNPLDVTPILGDEGFEQAARAVLEDPGVDVGVIGCVPLSGALETLPAGAGHAEDLLRGTSVGSRLVRLHGETSKPWVAVVDAGPLYDPLARHLERGGVPTFRSADRALRALSRLAVLRTGGPPPATLRP